MSTPSSSSSSPEPKEGRADKKLGLRSCPPNIALFLIVFSTVDFSVVLSALLAGQEIHLLHYFVTGLASALDFLLLAVIIVRIRYNKLSENARIGVLASYMGFKLGAVLGMFKLCVVTGMYCVFVWMAPASYITWSVAGLGFLSIAEIIVLIKYLIRYKKLSEEARIGGLASFIGYQLGVVIGMLYAFLWILPDDLYPD
jgi:hypothetical protein